MVETEGNMDLKPFIFLKLLVMESSRLWFELLEWKRVQCAVKEGFLFCLFSVLILIEFNKIALTKVIAEIWEQVDISRKTSDGAKKQALKAIRTNWFGKENSYYNHQYFSARGSEFRGNKLCILHFLL